eukprot:2150733-Amphidinium_carterae.1
MKSQSPEKFLAEQLLRHCWKKVIPSNSRDRLYVALKDVENELAPQIWDRVSFFLYRDEKGMGASDVRVEYSRHATSEDFSQSCLEVLRQLA